MPRPVGQGSGGDDGGRGGREQNPPRAPGPSPAQPPRQINGPVSGQRPPVFHTLDSAHTYQIHQNAQAFDNNFIQDMPHVAGWLTSSHNLEHPAVRAIGAGLKTAWPWLKNINSTPENPGSGDLLAVRAAALEAADYNQSLNLHYHADKKHAIPAVDEENRQRLLAAMGVTSKRDHMLVASAVMNRKPLPQNVNYKGDPTPTRIMPLAGRWFQGNVEEYQQQTQAEAQKILDKYAVRETPENMLLETQASTRAGVGTVAGQQELNAAKNLVTGPDGKTFSHYAIGSGQTEVNIWTPQMASFMQANADAAGHMISDGSGAIIRIQTNSTTSVAFKTALALVEARYPGQPVALIGNAEKEPLGKQAVIGTTAAANLAMQVMVAPFNAIGAGIDKAANFTGSIPVVGKPLEAGFLPLKGVEKAMALPSMVMNPLGNAIGRQVADVTGISRDNPNYDNVVNGTNAIVQLIGTHYLMKIAGGVKSGFTELNMDHAATIENSGYLKGVTQNLVSSIARTGSVEQFMNGPGRVVVDIMKSYSDKLVQGDVPRSDTIARVARVFKIDPRFAEAIVNATGKDEARANFTEVWDSALKGQPLKGTTLDPTLEDKMTVNRARAEELRNQIQERVAKRPLEINNDAWNAEHELPAKVKAATSDPNYVYHMTPAENFDSIQQNGLQPGAERPGEETAVFWADRASAYLPTANGESPMVLRTSADTAGLVSSGRMEDAIAQGGASDEWVSGSVPSSSIEFLDQNGEWQPLDPSGSPEHQANIDEVTQLDAEHARMQRQAGFIPSPTVDLHVPRIGSIRRVAQAMDSPQSRGILSALYDPASLRATAWTRLTEGYVPNNWKSWFGPDGTGNDFNKAYNWYRQAMAAAKMPERRIAARLGELTKVTSNEELFQFESDLFDEMGDYAKTPEMQAEWKNLLKGNHSAQNYGTIWITGADGVAREEPVLYNLDENGAFKPQPATEYQLKSSWSRPSPRMLKDSFTIRGALEQRAEARGGLVGRAFTTSRAILRASTAIQKPLVITQLGFAIPRLILRTSLDGFFRNTLHPDFRIFDPTSLRQPGNGLIEITRNDGTKVRAYMGTGDMSDLQAVKKLSKKLNVPVENILLISPDDLSSFMGNNALEGSSQGVKWRNQLTSELDTGTIKQQDIKKQQVYNQILNNWRAMAGDRGWQVWAAHDRSARVLAKWLKEDPAGQDYARNIESSLKDKNGQPWSIDEYAKRQAQEWDQALLGDPRLAKAILNGDWNVGSRAFDEDYEKVHPEIFSDASELKTQHDDLVESQNNLRNQIDLAYKERDYARVRALRLESLANDEKRLEIEKQLELKGRHLDIFNGKHQGAIIKELEARRLDGRLTLPPSVKVADEIADISPGLARIERGLYRPERVHMAADSRLVRAPLWRRAAKRYASQLIAGGADVPEALARARVLADADVAKQFYTMADRTPTDMALKHIFWFSPLVRQFMRVYAIDIPSRMYWPVGAALMANEAHAIGQLINALHPKDLSGNKLDLPGGHALMQVMMRLAGAEDQKGFTSLAFNPGGLSMVTTAGLGLNPSPIFQEIIQQASLHTNIKALKALNGWANGTYPPALLPSGMTQLAYYVWGPNSTVAKALGMLSPEVTKRYQYETMVEANKVAMRTVGPAPDMRKYLAQSQYQDPSGTGLNAAGTAAYNKAFKDWHAKMATEVNSIFRGYFLTKFLGESLLPMAVTPEDSGRTKWDTFMTDVIDKSPQAQHQQLITDFLKKNPSLAVYSVASTMLAHPLTKAQLQASGDINTFWNEVDAGTRQMIPEAQLPDWLAGTLQRRSMEQVQNENLASVSNSVSNYLLNGYKVSQQHNATNTAWSNYETLNPRFATLWEENHNNWDITFGRKDPSAADQLLAQAAHTIGSMATKAQEGTLSQQGLKNAKRTIEDALVSASNTPGGDSLLYQGVSDWWRNTGDPYLTQLNAAWDKVNQLKAQGADSISISNAYDNITAIQNKWENKVTFGPDGKPLPSPQAVMWGYMSPAAQKTELLKWQMQPQIWLSDFQLAKVYGGHAPPDNVISFLNQVKSVNKRAVNLMIKSGYTPHTTTWDNYLRQVQNAVVKYAQGGGPALVKAANSIYNPPILNLPKNFLPNNSNWTNIVNATQQVVAQFNKAGLSFYSDTSKSAIADKATIFAWIDKALPDDVALQGAFEQLSEALTPAGSPQPLTGWALYDRALFGVSRPVLDAEHQYAGDQLGGAQAGAGGNVGNAGTQLTAFHYSGHGTVTREQWSTALLHGLGAPLSRTNAAVITAWVLAESVSANGGTDQGGRWNPLNTTLPTRGSIGIYNSHNVQNYNSYGAGLDATIQTLTHTTNAGYSRIIEALRKNDAASAIQAIVASGWVSSKGSYGIERLNTLYDEVMSQWGATTGFRIGA